MKKIRSFLSSGIVFLSIVSVTHADIASGKIADHAWGPKIENGQLVWLGKDNRNRDTIYSWDRQTIKVVKGKNEAVVNRITNNKADEQYRSIEINNGQVMWQSFDGHNAKINFWDGNQTLVMHNSALNEKMFQIDNGQMVWTGVADMDDKFVIAFLDSGLPKKYPEPIRLDNQALDSNFYPQIDNGQVVWQGFDGHDTEIYFWDGNQTQQLTDNEKSDTLPQISNGLVVWTAFDGHDEEIFLWNSRNGKTVQLTNNDEDDIWPQIDNENVVWLLQGEVFTDEIFMAEIQPGTRLKDMRIFRVSDNIEDYDYQCPHIKNGDVVWAAFDGHDTEIMYWSKVLSDYDVDSSVYQITDNERNDEAPQTDGYGGVTWEGFTISKEDGERENQGIYYWDMR